MSKKKILAVLLGIFAAILIPTFLIQYIHPNWVTAYIVNFLTVDLFAFITKSTKWFVAAISGIVGTIALARNSIGNVKKTATAQVVTAQEQTQEANSNVTSLFTENQKLVTETIPQKDAQITDLNTKLETATLSSQETTAKITTLEAENLRLKTQLQYIDDKITTQGIPPNPNDSRVIDANTPKVA